MLAELKSCMLYKMRGVQKPMQFNYEEQDLNRFPPTGRGLFFTKA